MDAVRTGRREHDLRQQFVSKFRRHLRLDQASSTAVTARSTASSTFEFSAPPSEERTIRDPLLLVATTSSSGGPPENAASNACDQIRQTVFGPEAGDVHHRSKRDSGGEVLGGNIRRGGGRRSRRGRTGYRGRGNRPLRDGDRFAGRRDARIHPPSANATSNLAWAGARRRCSEVRTGTGFSGTAPPFAPAGWPRFPFARRTGASSVSSQSDQYFSALALSPAVAARTPASRNIVPANEASSCRRAVSKARSSRTAWAAAQSSRPTHIVAASQTTSCSLASARWRAFAFSPAANVSSGLSATRFARSAAPPGELVPPPTDVVPQHPSHVQRPIVGTLRHQPSESFVEFLDLLFVTRNSLQSDPHQAAGPGPSGEVLHDRLTRPSTVRGRRSGRIGHPRHQQLGGRNPRHSPRLLAVQSIQQAARVGRFLQSPERDHVRLVQLPREVVVIPVPPRDRSKLGRIGQAAPRHHGPSNG